MRKFFVSLLSASLTISGLALVSPAQATGPTWVDFDPSPSAPYAGVKSGVGNAYADHIPTVHNVGGKYFFFRGPALFSFDPSTPATPPQSLTTSPVRDSRDQNTNYLLPTFAIGQKLIYSAEPGVWVYDTATQATNEIVAGANRLVNMRGLTEFNNQVVFVAQISGSAAGVGWGIYSVDLSVPPAGTPATYPATLRKSSSFTIGTYGTWSATYGDLLFFADGSEANVWVMDTEWDSEELVNISPTSNTQAGYFVAVNDHLGFKARTDNTSDAQAEYFVMDISGITTTTVDGTASVIDASSPLLTRLLMTENSNAVFNVVGDSGPVGIANRYILVGSQTQFSPVYAFDTQTSQLSRVVTSGYNIGTPMKPFKLGGVDYALIAIGNEIRSVNPASGDFGVQVANVSSLINVPIYDFSVIDSNSDGNADVAAFGVADWGSPVRWFHAPTSNFVATAAYKKVTFDANTGTGSMAPQYGVANDALIANAFTNTGFVLDSWNTAADGSGTSYAEGAPFPFAADTTLFAQWALPQSTPAPYTGPLLQDFSSRTLDPCTPKSITITGTRLSGVTASIQGKSVTVLENTDTKLVLAFPAGLTPGSGVDLDINSSSGKLTVQNAFDIPANTCSLELSKGRWTQLQSDGKTVKMYAKDPVGDGKIQFFVDGKEIAWINAVDLTDPKLSFASSNPYLVRSVTLNPGKNRFEIKLDGVRVWRATYVPKG